MSASGTLLIAHEGDFAGALARALGADCSLLSRRSDDAALEQWRETLSAERRCGAVVVALAPGTAPVPQPLDRLDEKAWSDRAADPFLAWCVALGAAAECCTDGGAIVAVIESPPPLDAAGFAPEAGLADAVGALVRSIAAAEGGRGVRANAVTTPARLAPASQPAATNGLDAAAGGVVRWLLSESAAAISGRTLPADGGRSW